MKRYLRLPTLVGVMAFFFMWCVPALAGVTSPEGQASPVSDSWQMKWPAGVLMLVLLFSAFFAMTRYEVPLPLAMTLVSLSFLIIQWKARR